MADFTIASQVGGGQNAMAGGGGFNPNSMFQLMQMKQTMELQRLAEQRAAAAEGRAAALHVPQLGAANLRLQEAEMELKKKREDYEVSNLYSDIRTRYKDPFSDEALAEAKGKSPKLYSTLLDQKAAQTKLDAEADVKTKEGLLKGLELNQKTAGLWLPLIENGLVTDQKTYSAMREDILRGQKNFAAAFPEEYSPEAVQKFKIAFSGTKNITTQSMAGGDVLVLVNGKPYGMVDPTIKDGAVPGVRPFGPGEAPAVPTTAAPATVQPRAAAPQTMGFSGMGQLTPVGQQAAQTVLQNFPGARITSGLRTPERNAAVGGAQKSYHLTGNAIDVVPPAGMPMNVFAAQLRAQLGPMGYTVMYGDPGHLDHVHIQPGAGDAMNTPRQFNPSIAATDIAAGRTPTSMFAPANAMVPLAAMSLMQSQNAMVQPPAPANIAPGLTAAATPAAGIAAPATATSENRPVRSPDETYGAYTKRLERWETEQAEIRKERRKAEEAAKPKQLTPMQEKKLRDDVATDHKATMTTLEKVDMAVKTINKFRELPDDQKDKILGYSGALTPNISGAAKQAYTRFKDIEGQVTSMGKDLATLSGSIGSIANQEWGIMRDQVASIDLKNMDVKTLNQQLDRIEAMAKGIANRARDSYRRQYQEELQRFGDRFNIPETTKTPVRTGTYGGKKVVEYSDGTIDYAD